MNAALPQFVTAPQFETPVATGLVWRLGVAGVGAVAAFVNVTLAARLLEPSDFAGFLLVSLALVIGPPLARHGTGKAVVRQMAQSRADGDALGAAVAGRHALSATVVVGAPASLIVGIVVMAGHGPSWRVDAILVALIVATEAYRLSASDVALGSERHVLAGLLAHPTRVAASSILLVVLMLTTSQATLTTVLSGILAINTALAITSRRCIAHDLKVFASRPARIALGAGMAASVPFLLVELAGMVLARGDVWIAARTLDGAEAAGYGAAATLAAQLMLPTAVVGIVLSPVIARLWRLGLHQELQDLLTAAATLSLAVVILPALVAISAPAAILRVVFGSDIDVAVVPYAVLVIGSMAFAITGVSGAALLMTGGVLTAAAVGVPIALAAVPAGWLASQAWGASGLAAAATSALIVATAVEVLVLRIRTGLLTLPGTDPRRALRTVLAAGASNATTRAGRHL